MTVSDMVGDVGSRSHNLSINEVGCLGSRGRSFLEAGTGNRPDLIQTHGSIELPATGHWAIPSGQHLDATRRVPWSRRQLASTIGGRLDIPIDPFVMRLELTLAFGDDRRFPDVLCEVTLVDADRLGRWGFAGTASIGSRPSASITLRAWYQGVYDHGARPVALLRVRTRLPTPGVDLLGDINACRLFTYPALHRVDRSPDHAGLRSD